MLADVRPGSKPTSADDQKKYALSLRADMTHFEYTS